MTKRALEYVSTGQRRRHGLWSATILFVFEVTLYSRLCLLKVCAPLIGRVENSKTFQNQMAQCFFIGLYDIENGDDFYFFQKYFVDRWKWILKKSIYTREKWLK